jgi:glycosyltransferase involved in cell wall biosynthesis
MQSIDATHERGKEVTPTRALPSILTTHHKRQNPEWTARTVLLPGWFEAFGRANLSYLRGFWWALRLFLESRRYDAVVTGAEHCGMMFAMLQTLFRRPSDRRVHVMIDFPWSAQPGRLMMALKALQMRVATPSLDTIFAHASPEEAERFTKALRVRKGLFRFVPYHYLLEEPLPEITRGDFIFSGGNSGRDYPTLLEALAGSDHPAILCTQTRLGLDDAPLPDHMQVTGVSEERFYQLMAQAALVVVPLVKGDIHPGGHTVVVTAMALGKPIVVAAPSEYQSYINDGNTGLITPPGDASALRAAIERILSDTEFAGRLGRNAKAASARFAPGKFFACVFECVDRAVAQKQNAPLSATRRNT